MSCILNWLLTIAIILIIKEVIHLFISKNCDHKFNNILKKLI